MHEAFRRIESSRVGSVGGIATADDDARVLYLKQMAASGTAEQFQCRMNNDWEKLVFFALLKRYGLKPFRCRKQRQSTVLVRIDKSYMNNFLWPVFQEVNQLLVARFNEILSTFLPTVAPGPFVLQVLNHDHGQERLCEVNASWMANSLAYYFASGSGHSPVSCQIS